jgi:hypothetical protein
MNRKLTYPILASLTLASYVAAQWQPIVDLDADYSVGDDQAAMEAKGWYFQEGDYYGSADCANGVIDCNGVREIVSSPYTPATGSSKSIMLRAGDPEEGTPINAISISAYNLPVEVPVGEVVTIYFHFAVERPEGARNFVVSEKIFTNSNTKDNLEGSWGDGTCIQWNSASALLIHQGDGYIPANEDTTMNKMQSEVWYDMWLHIDNQATTTGDTLGSRYDLYIRGGQYGDTITHLPNTADIFQSAEFEPWLFRDDNDRPLRSVHFPMGTGNPASNYVGTAAIYINDLQMYLGDFVLEVPVAGDKWANRWDVASDGWVKTTDPATGSDFLGWVNVSKKPWIFSQAYDKYIYLPEAFVNSYGAWSYVLLTPPSTSGTDWAHWSFADSQGWVKTTDPETGSNFLGWLNANKAPWLFSGALNKYHYIPESYVMDSGAWVFTPLTETSAQ